MAKLARTAFSDSELIIVKIFAESKVKFSMILPYPYVSAHVCFVILMIRIIMSLYDIFFDDSASFNSRVRPRLLKTVNSSLLKSISTSVG